MNPAFWLLLVTAGLFALLFALELVRPDREARYRRWPLNLGLGALMLVIGRLTPMIAPLTVAVWAQSAGFGVFNLVALPAWAVLILSIIAMDCSIYWQHRVFHLLPWFWRWHRLHHRDEAMDLSTGLRFHPMEGVISLLWKSVSAALLGIPPWAVPLFELWLTCGSMIEHSNIRLPERLDRVIRPIWVTPAMHRVHHSAHGDDAQHNFGFAIAAWDRLFGSYREAPSGPRIGIE